MRMKATKRNGKGGVKVSLLLLLLLCIMIEVQTQSTCEVNGIDLSPLTIPPGGTYYTATYPSNGDVFTWNICGPVVSQCTLAGTSVCQATSGDRYWSCGHYYTQTIDSKFFRFHRKSKFIKII